MSVGERFDRRTRQGLLLVALVYMVGWSLGRAQGRVEATKEALSASRKGRS